VQPFPTKITINLDIGQDFIVPHATSVAAVCVCTKIFRKMCIVTACYCLQFSSDTYIAGLHNSETSRARLININFPQAAKVYFVVQYLEKILEW